MEPKPFVYTFRQHINFFAFFLICALKAQHISQQSIIRAIVFFLCMMRPFGRSRMLCATCQQSRWWQTNSRIMKRVFLCCFVLLVWSPSARSCLLIASHVQRLTRMSCSVSLAPPNIFLFCPNVFFSGSFVKATERRVKCKTDSALFVIEDRH